MKPQMKYIDIVDNNKEIIRYTNVKEALLRCLLNVLGAMLLIIHNI